jgi:hypothetical protein
MSSFLESTGGAEDTAELATKRGRFGSELARRDKTHTTQTTSNIRLGDEMRPQANAHDMGLPETLGRLFMS